MATRAFVRIDGFGNLVAHSPEVEGMAQCLDSNTGQKRPFGAYCFKLSFTPVSVIATPIAHPDDSPFEPVLYAAGPNIVGPFTKDKNGAGVECSPGFQNAAVYGRRQAGDGIGVPRGGFFAVFD